MNIIDIESIEKIEEYLFALGASAVSLKTAHALQSKALSSAFLETDEREAVETIRYELGRCLVAISNLMRIMDDRAVINVSEIGEQMQAKCKEAVKKLQDH